MNDMDDRKLAGEIERHLAAHCAGVPTPVIGIDRERWQQIIAALRQSDLAQTEIKGHMRVKDDLQVELDAHKTVIGLLFESLPECPRMGDLPECVDDLKVRIAELEKVICESRMPHGLCHVMGSCTACTAQQTLDGIAVALKSRA